MLTKDYIFKQLKDMGAPRNKIVIAHASLRAIGKIENGAEALLDALIDYFTLDGGVLCVPTHTWSNFYDNKKFAMDCCSKKTCIGTFADVALADGRGKRTLNPTHSLCLFGKSDVVEKIWQSENMVDTPTSPFGAYGNLLDDGYVLLMGVGQEKNTILHCVEELMNVPNRLFKTPAKMKIKMENGEITEKSFYYMWSEKIEDVSVFFPKYEPAFRYYGGIADGFIGNAKTQLCSVRIMADVMKIVRRRSLGVEILSNDKPLLEKWYK